MEEVKPLCDVGGLVLKMYSHFSSSALRLEKYKKLCQSEADNNPEEDIIFEEVLRHVITRWSSLKPAIDRILRRWTQLKKYFLISQKQAKSSGDRDEIILKAMIEHEDKTLIALNFLSRTMS